METRLQLLMRDGALEFAFRPKLGSEQYLALLEAAKQATTREELRRAVAQLAARWGNDARCDEHQLAAPT